MESTQLQLSGKYKIILGILFCTLMYFGFVMYLNSFCMQRWDEARCALQSYEMLKSHNYIVVQYHGTADMWYTKPPLLNWMQVLSFKLFSVNIIAFRLPSVLAAIGVCVFIYWYFIRYSSNYFIGMLVAVVLVSCEGIARLHGSRTGEYDMLLTFFTTTYLISFYQYIVSKNRKCLLTFFVLITLAALTKGIQALLFLPALFIHALLSKNIVLILKTKEFYVGIFIFLFFVLGYYFLREQYNPGYLKTVWENELGGRYNTALEGHQAPFSFYLDNTYHRFFTFWSPVFLLIIPYLLFIENKKFKNISVYLLICIVCYFLVISSAKTKLEWYDMPVYPLIAILIAIALNSIFESVFRYCDTKLQRYTFIFILCCVLLIPFLLNMRQLYKAAKTQQEDPYMEVSLYLHKALKNHVNLDNCYVQGDLQNTYSPQVEFYRYLFEKRNQKMHLFYWNLDTIAPPCLAIIERNETKVEIENKYDYNVIEEIKHVKFYQILKAK